MMMRRYYCFLVFIAVFGLSNSVGMESNQKFSGTCNKSVEIKSLKDFELLKNCRIVVGHIRIFNLQFSPTVLPAPLDVEEITDYLVIYRVHGLITLQTIFPHLKIIRGEELLFDQYSFVVYENRDLENLGLISLLRVQLGAIRIERNPVLCFVDTINWVYLLGNSTRQRFSFDNKPSNQCPLCIENIQHADENTTHRRHCWNFDAYQKNTIFGNLTNCSAECGTRGCGANGACCSRRCLTGCTDNNCELCGTYKQNGRCVDVCGFTFFQLNKRDCVRESDCIRNNLVPHAGACLEKCPKHFEKKSIGGIPRCILPCSGNYTINSVEDLSGLKDCSILQGSLTIELKEIRVKIVEKLERALGNIKEITGYLKIKNSPQIVSLQFLGNLMSIGGNNLIDDKYAFYVVNNVHLEHIWGPKQKVSIVNGRLYFHLNPRLCREKIQELSSSLKAGYKITAVDASPNSNGERVVCGESLHTLNATIEDYNSTAVRIKVNPLPFDDMLILVGYAHYYKEAPQKNITHFDGRHGCGHDDWLLDISASRNVRHIIGNLKPYTQYAFFVKTLTMTDYHTQLDAYSDIQYFRTLPSKPGPPAKIYYHTISTSEIMIHWWPPLSPNGVITNYLVSYEKIKEDNNLDATTNYLIGAIKKPARDICKCNLRDPFYSGAPPEDENYYNKEQLAYDEGMTNFVYYKRPTPSQNEEQNVSEIINSMEYNNNNNSTEFEDSSNKAIGVNEAICILQKNTQENERKSLATQDTGIKDFPIKKIPICKQDNASVQYQLENDCRAIEHFEGLRLPGHIHQHILNGLDEESSYKISVRACEENGECGGVASVAVKTISKTLEDFFRGAQTLANDIEE